MSARAEFVPIPSKPFLTFDHGVAADGDLIFSGEYQPLESQLDGAVVRVRYTATEEEARRIDHAQIRRSLLAAGASRVTIEPTIIREARARAEQIDEQLTALEALGAYIVAQDIDPDTGLLMLGKLEEWLAA